MIASACPVIYLYLATVTTPRNPEAGTRSDDADQTDHADPRTDSVTDSDCAEMTSTNYVEWDSSWSSRATCFYFHFYFFVGIAAFSNFLPWT